MTNTATQEIVRYTVNLTIERPIRREEWDATYTEMEHLSSYTERPTLREIEKEIIKALRKLDGDADCEVMDAQIVSES